MSIALKTLLLAPLFTLLVGNTPGMRAEHTLTYHPQLGAAILFGGYAPNGVVLADIYAHDTYWRMLDPSPRSERALGTVRHLRCGLPNAGSVWRHARCHSVHVA